mmetsp:Transcript_10537/g.31212  ORF Transcript_10537/g.31212 Transcript_10537/m.31212 type:complete len:319 (-) Transcript_10537:89-1045(-)
MPCISRIASMSSPGRYFFAEVGTHGLMASVTMPTRATLAALLSTSSTTLAWCARGSKKGESSVTSALAGVFPRLGQTTSVMYHVGSRVSSQSRKTIGLVSDSSSSSSSSSSALTSAASGIDAGEGETRVGVAGSRSAGSGILLGIVSAPSVADDRQAVVLRLRWSLRNLVWAVSSSRHWADMFATRCIASERCSSFSGDMSVSPVCRQTKGAPVAFTSSTLSQNSVSAWSPEFLEPERDLRDFLEEDFLSSVMMWRSGWTPAFLTGHVTERTNPLPSSGETSSLKPESPECVEALLGVAVLVCRSGETDILPLRSGGA